MALAPRCSVVVVSDDGAQLPLGDDGCSVLDSERIDEVLLETLLEALVSVTGGFSTDVAVACAKLLDRSEQSTLARRHRSHDGLVLSQRIFNKRHRLHVLICLMLGIWSSSQVFWPYEFEWRGSDVPRAPKKNGRPCLATHLAYIWYSLELKCLQTTCFLGPITYCN